MHLILSTGVPWNANYCNEDGQVLYKAKSPGIGFGGRIIKISRVVPPVINEDVDNVGESELRDVYEPMAEVHYRTWGRESRIKYRLVDQTVTTFFRKGGYSFYGRNHYFNGPDGREYVWKLTMKVCKLFLNDAANTPVAVFHRKGRGIFRERRPASLEIFPEGHHMIELIVLTFIYVERLRDRCEEAARNSA